MKAFPSGLHFNRMQGAAVKSKKRISYLISLRNDSMVFPSASTRLLIERSNCENEMVKTARYHLLSCLLESKQIFATTVLKFVVRLLDLHTLCTYDTYHT
jgi:hypothetical protein